MKYILLFILLTLNFTIWAQLYCKNYDVTDGLPSENITAVAEDNDGYIYVGTSNGLSYFDGISFKTLTENGKGDIPYNVFVDEILFDQKNDLWMATEHNGLFKLETHSNTWTNIEFDNSQNGHSLVNSIKELEIFKDKILCAIENKGLFLIDINTLEISAFNKLKDQTITDIHLESNGKALITTLQAIYRVSGFEADDIIDTLHQTDLRLDFLKSYTLSDNSSYTISYTKGLFKIENKVLIPMTQPDILDTWRYNFIDEYDGKHWLTITNFGIASINIKTGEWQLYESEAFNKNTLPKGKYTTGIKDSRNMLWIGTSKGISCIDPTLQALQNIKNHIPTNEFLIDAVYDRNTSKYVMIYASEKNKVKFFDNQFSNTISYNHTPDIEYIQSLRNLVPYKGDYFCIGHEIRKIDGITGITSEANFPGYGKIKNPRAITIDDENNLWVIHDGNKLMQYYLPNDKLVQEITLPNLNKSSNIRPRRIYNCKKHIAIVAQDIFFMLDKTTMEITSYDINKTNKSINKIDDYPLQKGSIMQVVEYNDFFYICSRDEGIYKVKYSKETSNFSVIASLSSSEIYGPLELEMDSDNDIWIATDNGLKVVDKDLNVRKTISAKEGLLKTKLSQGLSIANGNIILNSENGITIADTRSLKKISEVLPVDIKDVLVNNEALDIYNKHVTLPPTSNNIQINVSMPLYNSINNSKYLYRLLPIKEEWHAVKLSQNLFRFDNLQPETYTFEIKANIGENVGGVTQFSFIIKPPFWRTWWFFLLSCMLIFSVGTWAYKARVRNRVKNEKVKTKLAELQNEAIRAQLNPHFIFNALNSIRSLILMDKKEDSLTYLGRFSTLVREVLSSSKVDIITLTRELEFNENYVNIERLRFSQSFSYEVIIDEAINTDHVKVPPMIMQPFIENAIWHGLLGKESNAKLKVNITVKEEWLFIQIDDNGTGRVKKDTMLKTYKTKKAFGELLSRQRLQSIDDGAEINIIDKVENGSPSGTTVIIKLPLYHE